MGYIEDLRAKIGHDRIILPGSVAVICNAAGQVLMQQRRNPHGTWGLPGGLMELGESAEQTAVREVLEETGLQIEQLVLVGVYSGEEYLCSDPNGDEWYVVTVAYHTQCYTGIPRICDDESLALQWLDPKQLPENTAKTHRYIIRDYLNQMTCL